MRQEAPEDTRCAVVKIQLKYKFNKREVKDDCGTSHSHSGEREN